MLMLHLPIQLKNRLRWLPSDQKRDLRPRRGALSRKPPKNTFELMPRPERMSSMLIRMISNSVGEFEGLIAELQRAQDYMKSEGERIQREITNFAQLNQSALGAIKVITDTIGPWKSAVLDDSRNSDVNSDQPVGQRADGLSIPGLIAA